MIDLLFLHSLAKLFHMKTCTFIKIYLLTTFSVLITLSGKAQENLPISGSLNCTIEGRPWKGKVQSAIYSTKDDYFTAGFEDDSARIEVTLRFVKKEISKNIPYEDMIQGEFRAGYDRNLIFFVRYFPNKRFANNIETAYQLLKGGFAVDALDLNAKTIKLAFDVICGKAGRNFNPMRPNENDLVKISIKNAETTEIKFLSF